METVHVPKKRGRKPYKETPEVIKALRKKAATALTVTDLAEELGVGATTIRRWIEKYEISMPNGRKMDSTSFQNSPRRRLSDQELQEIINLREEGLTYRAIAQKIECSVSSVYDALERSRGGRSGAATEELEIDGMA
jgi:transposase